jgi:hypothetical protein
MHVQFNFSSDFSLADLISLFKLRYDSTYFIKITSVKNHIAIAIKLELQAEPIPIVEILLHLHSCVNAAIQLICKTGHMCLKISHTREIYFSHTLYKGLTD